MRIEEEIQSNNFEDNYHKLVINVSYTYGWLSHAFRFQFEKHNLTQQQFNILRILRGQYPNPATVNLLKERMLDKMSDASRIVDRLVQTGLDILCKMDAEFKTKDILKNNLTEEEAGQLSDLLDKLRG